MNSKHYRRIIAFVIDLILISIIVKMLEKFIPIKIEYNRFNLYGIEFINSFSFKFIILFFYLLIFDYANKGITIGKKIMTISVVKEDNQEMSKKELIKRTFFKSISFFFLPLSVLIFLLKKITLQDEILKTKIT